jgi:hypothetical protein
MTESDSTSKRQPPEEQRGVFTDGIQQGAGSTIGVGGVTGVAIAAKAVIAKVRKPKNPPESK